MDAATTPAEATVGFLVGGVLTGETTVTPPQTVALQITTTPHLARQVYILHVIAASGGQQQVIEVRLNTNSYQISLPMIMSGYTGTAP
jgi:hypothetical protein